MASSRFAGTVDHGARQFHARHLSLGTDQFDLEAHCRGFALQPPPQVVLYQLDIFRRDELAQRAADDLRSAQVEQSEETRVGE